MKSHKTLRKIILTFVLVACAASSAQAKVLRFEETNTALELGGAGYYLYAFNPFASILETTNQSIPATSSLVYGLGVSAMIHINIHNLIQVRLGGETLLTPGATFSGAGQTWQVYTHSYNALAGADLSMLRRGSLRIYLGIMGGYALTMLDVDDQALTNSQSNAWADNYDWSISSLNWLGDAHLGIDFNAFDFWTFGLEAGYRIFNQGNWIAAQSFQVSSRSFSAKQQLQNSDGTATAISFSAPYAALRLSLYF